MESKNQTDVSTMAANKFSELYRVLTKKENLSDGSKTRVELSLCLLQKELVRK
jgi:hypothetical protein